MKYLLTTILIIAAFSCHKPIQQVAEPVDQNEFSAEMIGIDSIHITLPEHKQVDIFDVRKDQNIYSGFLKSTDTILSEFSFKNERLRVCIDKQCRCELIRNNSTNNKTDY